MKSKTFFFIKLIISFLVLFAIWNAINFDLSNLKITLNYKIVFFAFFFLLISLSIRALRWHFLLKNSVKDKYSFLLSFKYLLIGVSLNMVLPAGGGDVLKGYFASKIEGKGNVFFTVSIYDKIVAISSISFLALYALYLSNSIIYLLVFFITSFPLFFVILFSKNYLFGLKEYLTKRNARKKNKLFSLLLSIKDYKWSVILKCILLSILGWIFTYVLLYISFEITKSSISLSEVMRESSVLTIGRLFPFTFNGLGTDEALILYLFNGDRISILTGALIYRFILMVVPAFIGLFFIFSLKNKILK